MAHSFRPICPFPLQSSHGRYPPTRMFEAALGKEALTRHWEQKTWIPPASNRELITKNHTEKRKDVKRSVPGVPRLQHCLRIESRQSEERFPPSLEDVHVAYTRRGLSVFMLVLHREPVTLDSESFCIHILLSMYKH